MRQETLNEVAVIGSLLLDPAVLPQLEQAGLTPDMFDDPDCRVIYETVLRLRDEGRNYSNIVILGDEAKKVGFKDYSSFLLDAMRDTPSAALALDYAALVISEYKRRSLNLLLHEAAYDSEAGDWQSVAESVAEGLQNIGTGDEQGLTSGSGLVSHFRKYYQQTKEDPSRAYCPTGFRELDDQLGGGMFRSEIYVLGARPGMGKTTFALNIAESLVRMGKAVLFISMEMTADQIMAKRISIESGISYNQVLTGRVPSYEEEKLEQAIEAIENRPFYLTTKSGLTVSDIGRYARRVKDLALIVIDYLGLISPDKEMISKTRYEQMTAISASVKAMAKTLNVPVLALSQLNRENTNRQDKRPSMSDLRDSGAIEQDAGAIILLHRESYYGQTSQANEDIELNVAKNRHSSPGVVTMAWNGTAGRTDEKTVIPFNVMDAEELPF